MEIRNYFLAPRAAAVSADCGLNEPDREKCSFGSGLHQGAATSAVRKMAKQAIAFSESLGRFKLEKHEYQQDE